MLALLSRDSTPSDPLTSGSATDGAPTQPELIGKQGSLAPPGFSHLHALLGAVACGFLLASLSLALLLLDVHNPAFLALAPLLVGGGGFGAGWIALLAPSQRVVRWSAGGVLLGLGITFLFACILPFYC